MKREFTSAAAWTAASSWLEQAAAAIVFVVIARLIGAEEFGLVAMAFAFVFLGEYIVRDTITEPIVERRELEEGRLEATFFSLVAFSLAITILLFVIARFTGDIYDNAQVGPLMMVAAPTVILIGLGGVSTALLRRRMEYKTLAIRTIVGVLAGGTVGIAMALWGFGAWSLIGQRLTEIGINTVLAVLGARWVPKRLPTRSEFGLIKGFGLRVVELRVWGLIVGQTPTVLLGIFADSRAAGFYALSIRMVEIVLKLTVRAIQSVAQSAVAALRRQSGATAPFFLELTELTALVSFTSFAGLALIAYPLTDVLLGPEWQPVSVILPIMCIAGAIKALISMNEAYLLAIDGLKPFVRAIRIEALIGLAIFPVASLYGGTAVAVAIVVQSALVLPLCTRAAQLPEAISTSSYLETFRAPAIVCAAMTLSLIIWRAFSLGNISDILYLVGAIIIGIAVAGTVVFGFMPKTRQRLKEYVAG